ncbi:MAG: SLC13 family permease [Thermomicrobiales bacterium]
MELTLEIGLAYGILLAAFVVFALDILPIDFVAFAIMAVILVLHDTLNMSLQEAVSGFSNSATVTVMAVFILSAGIQRTGAINYISRRMVEWGGREERRQIVTIQGITGPISMVINNTAAVAILIPAVIRMAREARRSPSKLLMPLSFVSQLAGVVTLIGTSTNILASELTDQAGLGGFSMFDFSSIGLLIFATGGLYLLLVAPHLLPDRGSDQTLERNYQVTEFLSELLVPEGSSFAGSTIAEARIRQEFGVQILEIIRGQQHIVSLRGDTDLLAGDILVVSGSADELVAIRDDPRLQIEAQARLEDTNQLPGEIRLLEVVIGPNSDLIGGTLISTNFRNRYDTTVIAMRRDGRVIRQRLGQVRFEFGDTLLLQGPAIAIERAKQERGFIVTEEPEIETFRTRRIPVALAIVGGVVLFAALGQPILVTAIVGAVLMVLTGCLTVQELHESIRWDVIFLLAGMIPVGIALENTGGAELLADLAVDSAAYIPSIAVLYVFYATTMVLTELISNNASVVVMVPIGISTALSLNLDPKAFILAIMFAASTAFTTPVGYQTNTMIYGPGGYRFTDFPRVGGPLNLLLLIVTPFYIWLIWGL